MSTSSVDVPEEVLSLLSARLGPLSFVGSGAWSSAYRFSRGPLDFVVRVGPCFEDFVVDEEMSIYASDSLPIPLVDQRGRLDLPNEQLYFCVSTFVPGTPLEEASNTEWADLVPAVADLLDSLRSIKRPDTNLWPSWPHTLANPADPNKRLSNWGHHLSKRSNQRAAYEASLKRLRKLSRLPHVRMIEPTLLHCDLINRNVHVHSNKISGVFDWGCSRWGDHLYDLAWFKFWSPWFPHLDFQLLMVELAKRWGHEPDPDRFDACLLHIGADHLVYNAVKGSPSDGRRLIDRMIELRLI